jgi:phytoene dehydrogenase-like protein
VCVLEEKHVVGGACRTEHPFPKVPGLAHSSGAYLLGVMPPELLQKLGLKLRLLRRDPHYFLPTMQGSRYLLFGSDSAGMQQQFIRHFSKEDWDAHCCLNEEIKQMREDLAPAMLQVRPLVHCTCIEVYPGIFRSSTSIKLSLVIRHELQGMFLR